MTRGNEGGTKNNEKKERRIKDDENKKNKGKRKWTKRNE